MNTGKKASLKNEPGDRLGTIRMCCSRHYGTNGGEVKVFQRGSGEITVFTGNKRRPFHYRPGNGGHHWGNMVYVPAVSAPRPPAV